MLDIIRKPSVAAIPGQSGAAMVRDYMGRNRGAWLSVADFIVRENLRAVFAAAASDAAPGKRSAGAASLAAALAASPSLPVGNHGEYLNPAPSQVAA